MNAHPRFFTVIAAFVAIVGAACSGDIASPAKTLAGARASLGGGVTSGADLQISGSANTGSPNAGAAFSYTFQVKNSGPDTATNVMFTDTLPSGTGYNYATAYGVVFPCSEANMIVTCNLGVIPKGSQANVVVNINAPIVVGTFANTGYTASNNADPQPSNNAVTVKAQVKTPLAACVLPDGQLTTTGMVMFGSLDSFAAYESFEYQVNGVNYWVVTNYFDGTQPLTSVINLDCKESPAQFVQVGNFVSVTGTVSGEVVLPGTTTAIPVLHASVIQVFTHKDRGA